MLSDDARSTLLKTDWHQGRNTDTSRFEAAYLSKGYPLLESAMRFLQEFGGLSLTYPHFRDSTAMDGCNFRADEACAWDREWLRDYEKHVGQTLVPLGHAFSDHMLLAMAEDGSVFAFFEDTVCRVGSNGEEAINALCEGRELECSELDECEEVAVASELLDAVRERLITAGWSPSRCIDVTLEAKAFRDANIEMTDQATEFLQSFGGLQIKTETGGELNVDPQAARAMLGRSEAEEIRARLGVQGLAPIGVASPGQIIVVVDDQGRVIGTMPGMLDWLVKYGDTPRAGLNAIVSGVGAITI